jgi:anti-sigma factor ChrR (cupin superfamily)
MSRSPLDNNPCDQSVQVSAYVLKALPPKEAAAVEAHIASCSHCRQELETLQPVADRFAFWPTNVLRPSASLQERLARRIAPETGDDPMLPSSGQWDEPAWEEVAPGILCKLMATDTKRHRVSMLVRLMPGVEYPPHTHAGLEELFLLDGELWIDDRKLYPGDYNRAEAGSGDKRVWSETGCTCVLITSTQDILESRSGS